MGRCLGVLKTAPLVVGALVLVHQVATSQGGEPARTRLTIWSANAQSNAYGGYSYSGVSPSESMLVQEQREVEVAASGDVRISGIASTVDPGSVQLRDLTEPGAAVTEQRFIPAASSPTALLERNVGQQITAVTAKGETTGTLRSVDETAIVVETGTGDARRLSVLRRDAVSDLRLAQTASTEPTFAWRLATKKAGKHTVELAYRADGISWTADYLAVLDETGRSLDFSAWATVHNGTGTSFDHAALTLVDNAAGGGSQSQNPYGRTSRPAPAPVRFAIANPVRLGNDESVQVELVPARLGIKVSPVVSFEAMPDPSSSFQSYPAADCSQFSGAGSDSGLSSLAVELDVPNKAVLPDGRVRLFKRAGDHLDVVNEEPLRTSPGTARISIATDSDITGDRRALACDVDESARTITERVQVKVTNKGSKTADVVVREFAWRWPVFTVTAEDGKSQRPSQQTLEYRITVPAKGTKSVTYGVKYTW